MPSARPVADLKASLVSREFPTITTWNRLEARPRSQIFDRALQAEVRDALWLLSKQWQMGEFRGSDAGSPVFARLLMEKTRLTRYQAAGQPVEPFEPTIPLETKVERRPVPMRCRPPARPAESISSALRAIRLMPSSSRRRLLP